MRPFLDPGDGSFLRPSADRTLTVVSTELVSGGVSATVAFTAGLPAGTLRAFWGAEDCGATLTNWAHSAKVGAIPANVSSAIVRLPTMAFSSPVR